MWALSCSVGCTFWWWICWGIYAQYSHYVLWWCGEMFLSTSLHLFQWLFREVNLCSYLHLYLAHIIIYRVLIATIKNKGKCPCPHCLIPKEWFPNLGSCQNQQQHSMLARVDDNSRWAKVEGSRRLIYEKHYALDGKAVNELLKDQSLVPTMVSAISYILLNMWLTVGLEHVLITATQFRL